MNLIPKQLYTVYTPVLCRVVDSVVLPDRMSWQKWILEVDSECNNNMPKNL